MTTNISEKFVASGFKELTAKIYPIEYLDDKSLCYTALGKRVLFAMTDAASEQGWITPSISMPISVEIVAYMPIPKGKPKWFKDSAKKGLLPCVSENASEVLRHIVDGMYASQIIKSKRQIYRTSIEFGYSAKPRIYITVKGMFQNIGDIKEIERGIIDGDNIQ